MITVLKGGFNPPRNRRRWRQVREDVALHEYNNTIQARKDGYFRLGRDGTGAPTEVLIGPANVWFSPLLGELSLNDFPDGFCFGNGATGPSIVSIKRQLPDGTVHTEPLLLAYLVFPYGTVLTPIQLLRLQEIVEGMPPGSPETHVWSDNWGPSGVLGLPDLLPPPPIQPSLPPTTAQLVRINSLTDAADEFLAASDARSPDRREKLLKLISQV